MPTKFTSVPEYFQSVSPDHLTALQQIRDVVLTAAPDAEEVISYNMPAIKQNGKVLVYYAANKSKLGFYPTPGPLQALSAQLTDYSTSKGSISFAYAEPLPKELIAQMVKLRLAEI